MEAKRVSLCHILGKIQSYHSLFQKLLLSHLSSVDPLYFLPFSSLKVICFLKSGRDNISVNSPAGAGIKKGYMLNYRYGIDMAYCSICLKQTILWLCLSDPSFHSELLLQVTMNTVDRPRHSEPFSKKTHFEVQEIDSKIMKRPKVRLYYADLEWS